MRKGTALTDEQKERRRTLMARHPVSTEPERTSAARTRFLAKFPDEESKRQYFADLSQKAARIRAVNTQIQREFALLATPENIATLQGLTGLLMKEAPEEGEGVTILEQIIALLRRQAPAGGEDE